jgi:hypothetical protein
LVTDPSELLRRGTGAGEGWFSFLIYCSDLQDALRLFFVFCGLFFVFN